MKQAHFFTRKELYDLVWSTAKKNLATQFGVSDVAIGRACRKANIPVPDRGYWARKLSGRAPVRPELPPRFPGSPDRVRIGGDSWATYWSVVSPTDPLPPEPVFSETLDSVRDRILGLVRKVAYPRLTVDMAHPVVRQLLLDEEERAKEYANRSYVWYQPRLSTPSDKRRLRIFNALFLALQRVGCRAFLETARDRRDDAEASVSVGGAFVALRLTEVVEKKRKTEEKPAKPTRLRLELVSVPQDTEMKKAWEDFESERIEQHLRDVVIEILFAGELQYRHSERQQYAWLVERKARQEEAERQRVLEVERKAQELEARRQRAEVGRLLSEATSLQRAATIRSYVATVRSRQGGLGVGPDVVERWAAWALSHADRIDPLRNPGSLRAFEERVDSHPV